MIGLICCRQRRKFESSSFYEIEFGKAKAEEEKIEFITIDYWLSSRYIQQLSPFECLDQIYIGNGQGFPIHSTGSSIFISSINSKVSMSLN